MDPIALVLEPRMWGIVLVLMSMEAAVLIGMQWGDARRSLIGAAVAKLVSTPVCLLLLLLWSTTPTGAALVLAAAVAIESVLLHALRREHALHTVAAVSVGNLVAWGPMLGLLYWASMAPMPEPRLQIVDPGNPFKDLKGVHIEQLAGPPVEGVPQRPRPGIDGVSAPPPEAPVGPEDGASPADELEED